MKKIISENLLRNIIKFQLVEHYKQKLLKEAIINDIGQIDQNTKKDLFYDFLKFFHTYIFVPALNENGVLPPDKIARIKSIKNQGDAKRREKLSALIKALQKSDMTYVMANNAEFTEITTKIGGTADPAKFEVKDSVYFNKTGGGADIPDKSACLIVGYGPFDYKNIVSDFYAGVKNVDGNSMKGYFTDDDIVECMQEIFEDYNKK